LPALTGTVSLTQDETVLTAHAALSGDDTLPVIYTWQRSVSQGGPWENIPGAAGLVKDVVSDDGSVYYVRSEDTGKYIRVRTSRAAGGGAPAVRGYVDSSAAGPIAAFPALSGTVTLTGTPKAGQTLTVNTNGLNGSGTLIVQWQRNAGVAGADTFFTAMTGANGGPYTPITGTSILLKNTDEYQTRDSGTEIRALVRRKGYTGYVKSAAIAAAK